MTVEKMTTKKEWIARIAVKAGVSADAVASQVNWAKDNLGIRPSQFFSWDLYGKTHPQMADKALRKGRVRQLRQKMYELIEESCGKTKAVVDEELKTIRGKGPAVPVNLRWYFRHGIYLFDPDEDMREIDRRICFTLRLKTLKERVGSLLEKYDNGAVTYQDIEEDIEEYRSILSVCLSPGREEQLWDIIKHVRPGLRNNRDRFHAAMVDMELTDVLLGFAPDEYTAFHFWEKTIPERLEYVSGKLRASVLGLLNSPEAVDTLNSKYEAYKKLKKYYGRHIELIDAAKGYAAFEKYCIEHSEFVRKNNFDSLGRGVRRITVTEDTDLKALYEDLTEDGKLIILEDLIRSATEIRTLNPDSVNTVRVIVYLDGWEPKVQDCFMKIGRSGSFIDNGGAGGILVHIDKETGMFDSTGIDEKGLRYEKHPDHGYTFKGYSLPDWESALSLAKKAIKDIRGLKYVGWDLTYTEEREWIIVEGNVRTQFFGQQATMNLGLRRDFLSSVGFETRATTRSFLEQETKENAEQFSDLGIEGKRLTKTRNQDLAKQQRRYIEAAGFVTLGYLPDLENPHTLNEKLLWLATNHTDPLFPADMSHKEVQARISHLIGEGYVIPTIGEYRFVSEIDAAALPKAFVIRKNGRGVSDPPVTVRNKAIFNERKLTELFLSELSGAEVVSLLLEEYIGDPRDIPLPEYTYYCFNGKPVFMSIGWRIDGEDTPVLMDMQGQILWATLGAAKLKEEPLQPSGRKEMRAIAKTLAKRSVFLKVGFCEWNGKVYVEQVSSMPDALMRFTTKAWDEDLGEKLILPKH